LVFLVGALGVNQLRSSHADTSHLCDKFYISTSLCLNRAGGIDKIGTHIIAYNNSNINENFGMVQVTSWCNHGYVSAATNCPFTVKSGLNKSLNGDYIVQIQDYDDPGYCVARDPTNTQNAALETCGAAGNIFVWNNARGTYAELENVSWSNYDNSARLLCDPGYKQQILINGGPAIIQERGLGVCQWTSAA
jgi:hypothetical protein